MFILYLFIRCIGVVWHWHCLASTSFYFCVLSSMELFIGGRCILVEGRCFCAEMPCILAEGSGYQFFNTGFICLLYDLFIHCFAFTFVLFIGCRGMYGVLFLWRGLLFSSMGSVSYLFKIFFLYFHCTYCIDVDYTKVLLGWHCFSGGVPYFIALCVAFVFFAFGFVLRLLLSFVCVAKFIQCYFCCFLVGLFCKSPFTLYHDLTYLFYSTYW